MKYQKIKTRKIYEQVAEQIRSMIEKGQLKPGDKLDSVKTLAENFNVGRSAVREALSALKAIGLVEIHQGEGTYVREFDPTTISLHISTAMLANPKDIMDLMEVRKIMEVGSAGVASLNWKEEDLIPIEAALDRMWKGLDSEEIGERADFDFHLAIASATHNDLLKNLMDKISEKIIETMRETRRIWIYSDKSTTQKLYHEHVSIYEAIKMRDPNLAQQRMMNHLIKVEEVLRQFYVKRNAPR